MHTLEQLRSGQLQGITRLDLAADLTELPEEVFQLADSLEVLNLSNNRLSDLPSTLPRLHKLRVLFCSDNPFTALPQVLGQCPQLEMVGFKSCQIEQVAADALSAKLRWLILTDNRISQLPEALGDCQYLQKLMLAGNRLTSLPASLSRCHNLELLRIAANRLQALPDWLLKLPRLAWLAYAGNPFCAHLEQAPAATLIPREQLSYAELLGQGASGIIHAATWQAPGQPAQEVAVKHFKGQMTSDGLPHCEMAACLLAGEQHNLIRVAGALQTAADEPPALVLERISSAYQVLAAPPSLSSCSRDCYAPEQQFSLKQLLSIAHGAAAAASHLHQRGILHGDLYGHNLLVKPSGHTLLGDFGAASRFDPQTEQGQALQRIEIRAWGILLEELIQRCPEAQATELLSLAQACMQEDLQQRPSFSEAVAKLAALLAALN
ncbi:leucine-rich repeat-containing protein kinase family protein [Pseudomonas sp. 5P_3.1_Bac2]|uniref:leucine-rich repeat-containing protein kinase family protein n=1 Tax=Pseudomonas sp. 5P_3.1_Bac2 TaxID=2971617 RepID=UPI0021C86974|nr:leucine-rich repeat-containing protein kinase family protein [Pseudomonas sp. 5P_3.1_Bac2]MCU1716886.1 leucine-rich repeat-containing serine/threonine-protein kinase [Pseudomonas sp. 5P_3.1_Bac2]